MRVDITPGGTFPDYELTDHTKARRKLSELQGNDPMVVVLSRGHYCPKDHQQHLELAAAYSKIAVAYTKIVTISTDNIVESRRVPGLGRRPVDFPLRRRAQGAEGPRHPGVHRPPPRPHDPAYPRAQASTRHPQRLQRLLVLGEAIARGPAPRPPRGDARDPPRLGSEHTWPARGLGGWRPVGVLSRRGPRPRAQDGVAGTAGHGSALVFVMAAPPDAALVAAQRRAVEPRVHAPEAVDASCIG